ncbi:MAG TPA: hypothetical protein VLH56_16410 [Dissulfurispiraceae bacterium]|nr:hypothetical protein [Dissulfurispiraceae bacterium]
MDIKAKVLQAIEILQGAIAGEDGPVLVNLAVGRYLRYPDGKLVKAIKVDGKWVPAPEPEPEPEKPKPEFMWPLVDYSNSRYTIGTCKTCVSYYSELYQFGFPGLVAEIKRFWDKKDTFYQPIKDFMKDYPELFPCVDC